ncbi:helix-turn-helix domain-containing protein [Leptobacterium flavescens]|uniref:Helix-turn-helix domain-containing protein n=1 Tax=Leptobacterium flavescens TaxID=472055 RepID=A0A6P0UM00_9FLAO|nr:helix-turn-helix domain-containing protein [Leptobacterium flavescens]NER14371.1 helix-turn-helix domain-containing protein [Leptobacterium flavescens]
MKLDLWSILMIVAIAHGVFVLLLFVFKKQLKGHNLFLLGLILLFGWFQLEFLAIRNVYSVNFPVFYGTRYGSWFLAGPLVYFYIRSITDSGWKFSSRELLHFLPFVVFVWIIPLLSADSLSRGQVHYGMLSVFDYRKKVVTPFQYLYSTVFVLQFIHLAFYLFLNHRLVRKYAGQIRDEYSNPDSNVRWLRWFNLIMVLILIFATVFLSLLFFSDIYRRHLDYIYVLPMGVLIYSIGFYFSGLQWKKTSEGEKEKYAKSSLQQDTVNRHIGQLKQLMVLEKPYLNNELRLKDLAVSVNLSPHHLSQLLNQHLHTSFFDFVNKYRVEEAKEIIESQPDLTMLQVAFDSGFNNKTSFVNAFRKYEKTTPSDFRMACLSS